MKRRKFNPGDKVRILPSWWYKLASERSAKHNEFVQNGIDYVYTVHHVSCSSIYLDGYCYGSWDEEYLIPADECAEDEINVDIDSLL